MLKENNPLYADIAGRESWEQACPEEDKDTWAELTIDTSENLQVDPTDTGENTEAGQQVADDIL